MLGFSGTLTATRSAVAEMSGTFVGFGRAVVAAVLALAVIAVRREPAPERRYWAAIARTSLGIVIGFPVLSALAVRAVPASHAQVFVGLTPFATALMAAWRFGERLPRVFWLSAVGGAISVAIFGFTYAGGAVHGADVLLLAAVLLVGFGYAEGARLARAIGGFRVVCWALVVALPLTLPVTLVALWDAAWVSVASVRAWSGFAYVSVISMFLAFFAWYRGLALGSIARTSQVQLAMPALGVLWAKLVLGEAIGVGTIVAGCLVVVFAVLAQSTTLGAQRGS